MLKAKWAWLEDRIKECGFKSRRQFAIAIDWNDARISDMVNNRPTANNKIPSFPKDKLTQVSELLRIDLKSLIQYNNDEIDTVVFLENSDAIVSQIRIPYLNIEASAGDGYHNDNEYIKSYLTLSSGKFSDVVHNIKQPATIVVNGNSMDPTLKDGELVLVDVACNTFEEGKIFVVLINDELYIKRLFKNPITKKIICSSDNPKNPSFEADISEIQIKAKLIKGLKDIS